jgi:hypothetical protein
MLGLQGALSRAPRPLAFAQWKDVETLLREASNELIRQRFERDRRAEVDESAVARLRTYALFLEAALDTELDAELRDDTAYLAASIHEYLAALAMTGKVGFSFESLSRAEFADDLLRAALLASRCHREAMTPVLIRRLLGALDELASDSTRARRGPPKGGLLLLRQVVGADFVYCHTSSDPAWRSLSCWLIGRIPDS